MTEHIIHFINSRVWEDHLKSFQETSEEICVKYPLLQVVIKKTLISYMELDSYAIPGHMFEVAKEIISRKHNMKIYEAWILYYALQANLKSYNQK